MDQNTIEGLGDELYQALVKREVLSPLTERHPEMRIEDAYRVQQRMIARRIEAGERIVGKKIGVMLRLSHYSRLIRNGRKIGANSTPICRKH